MPAEYVRTGASMNWPSSLNSTMSLKRASISRRGSPRIDPFRYTFSRPLRFALNPTPKLSRQPTLPRTSTWPRSASQMPASVFSSVDLPEPLRPMMPTTSPGQAVKSMPRRAQNSCCQRPFAFAAETIRTSRTNVSRRVTSAR